MKLNELHCSKRKGGGRLSFCMGIVVNIGLFVVASWSTWAIQTKDCNGRAFANGNPQTEEDCQRALPGAEKSKDWGTERNDGQDGGREGRTSLSS